MDRHHHQTNADCTRSESRSSLHHFSETVQAARRGFSSFSISPFCAFPVDGSTASRQEMVGSNQGLLTVLHAILWTQRLSTGNDDFGLRTRVDSDFRSRADTCAPRTVLHQGRLHSSLCYLVACVPMPLCMCRSAAVLCLLGGPVIATRELERGIQVSAPFRNDGLRPILLASIFSTVPSKKQLHPRRGTF
jgi:hypothetical protein